MIKSKFFLLIIILSVATTLLLFPQSLGASSNNMTPKTNKVSIVSVTDLTFSVKQGDTYNLPKTVQVLESDKSKVNRPVTWSPSSASTVKAGNFKFSGAIKGFNKKITLTLVVTPIQKNTVVLIEISQFAFNPDPVTINKGTKVKWINKDSVAHTVTGNGFDSGTLSNGGSFEFTFNKSGTFQYVCSFHSSMTGTIIVK